MFFTFILVSALYFEGTDFRGMPSDAAGIACGGTGAALTDDPAFFNPAMLPFVKTQWAKISYYGIKEERPVFARSGEFTAYSGKYINSLTAVTSGTAFFWRLLGAETADEVIGNNQTRASLRAEEAGMSFAIRDSDFYSFSAGASLKYFHASYRELTSPDTGSFTSDSVSYRSFPAHGLYLDAGIAYALPNFTLGVSAKNLAGKMFHDEISLSRSYRAGASLSAKFAALSYDFEYSETDYKITHHFCARSYLGPLSLFLGYAEKEDDKTAAFGYSLFYNRYSVSFSLWGPAENLKNEYMDYYLSIGASF
ncbi:hypothetical protein JW890_01970 [candidate division WOR-3 bacterium]|nr:hypothetical protein [candidate division WOR-3 bacterium]